MEKRTQSYRKNVIFNLQGQKDLRNMLLKRSSTTGSSSSSKEFDVNGFITKLEFDGMFANGYEFKPYFDDPKEYFSMSRGNYT